MTFYAYIFFPLSRPLTLTELDYLWVTRQLSYKKRKLLTFREHPRDHSRVFWWGECCSSFLVFCAGLLCIYTFLVPCCHVRYDFRKMSGSSLPPVVCRRVRVFNSCWHVTFKLKLYQSIKRTIEPKLFRLLWKWITTRTITTVKNVENLNK